MLFIYLLLLVVLLLIYKQLCKSISINTVFIHTSYDKIKASLLLKSFLMFILLQIMLVLLKHSFTLFLFRNISLRVPYFSLFPQCLHDLFLWISNRYKHGVSLVLGDITKCSIFLSNLSLSLGYFDSNNEHTIYLSQFNL